MLLSGLLKIVKMTSERKLKRAVELIKYFVQRVEEGSIRSRTTYNMYKSFLIDIGEYPEQKSLTTTPIDPNDDLAK